MTRLLFVCLGNICRSPTAEGVMRRLVAEAGLEEEILIDSAGTGDWHVGAPPDARATDAAARRGTTLAGEARRVGPADFEAFDLILAMDEENLRELRRIAPVETHDRIRKLREYDPSAAGSPDLDVPDPYHGGEHGFEHVLDLVERACRGLLDELRKG